MLTVLAVLLLGLVLIYKIASTLGVFADSTGERPLVQKKALLTANELEFWHRLRAALPAYQVLPQVAMGALLNPVASRKSGDFLRTRSRFSQKIIDFVVVDQTGKVIAIIELDDQTHDPVKDAKRDALLIQAGYKVVRFQSKNKPSTPEISERVAA